MLRCQADYESLELGLTADHHLMFLESSLHRSTPHNMLAIHDDVCMSCNEAGGELTCCDTCPRTCHSDIDQWHRCSTYSPSGDVRVR